MKTTLRFLQLASILLAVTGFYACEKNTDNAGSGSAEFSLSMPAELKSGTMLDSTNFSYQVMVSVEDMQGNKVFTDKLIPLYIFGTGFISEKIEIKSGEYRLTKFMVINTAGEVIYASPLVGSPLAYLINRPLPLIFNIVAKMTTQVTPEVLTVGNQTPDQFGYATFGVKIVKPLAFWTAAIIDNPLSMSPILQYTEARLTVYAQDGWHYSFSLKAELNQVIIRGGSEMYKLVVEKSGYKTIILEVPVRQLLAATKENPLWLKIPWDSYAYQTMVLQPGPDGGKDAMISNLEPEKNFGGHKYFEATFLSEPVLTVMRLNRSLIAFNLPQTFRSIQIKKVMLRLSYEVPVPFDSTIFIGTTPGNFIGGVLQQVVEPWEEYGVTWSKQPKTTEINQVYIPPFIRNTNFIEIDVTKLFVPPVNTDPVVYPNYGMLFRLWPEDKWPGFRFASSDHPNAALRPKLTIFYINQ